MVTPILKSYSFLSIKYLFIHFRKPGFWLVQVSHEIRLVIITVEALVSGHPRNVKKVSVTGAGRLREWFS